MDKVHVILKNGSQVSLPEWQKLYGLSIGSAQIGKHFSYTEPRFAKDLKDFGELIVNELLIRLLDAFRERIGKPVNINAFNRTEAYQKHLETLGYRTAEHSPHVAKMAADIDTLSAVETRDFVKILKIVAAELGIKIRLGFEQYLSDKMTFIHCDVCPEYFAKGKPFNSQTHPAPWENQITW